MKSKLGGAAISHIQLSETTQAHFLEPSALKGTAVAEANSGPGA
eukprot:CAMPEP_0174383422 /NCGR_PEP_ID=MMETSP0811_2-20130205/125221_1 /TAXON_ID=73025 ORGANISM="Eutreptiella gymnastica-like, Strain CCMP1594" /NCGR_SAMPLE_ID=MMETSP0811_2 /ASSEMBLY_ACC=CAM_ASM_000667 /LENGTH=43 /DNA_ID= /DNA_START= /DNA_END= /DNA_ORIENTATION=